MAEDEHSPKAAFSPIGSTAGVGVLAIAAVLLASPTTPAVAQQTSPAAAQNPPPTPAQSPQPADRRSPWMAVPMVSSTPKLGTSFGALGAYVTAFDPESQVSIFGVMYQYTSTDSSIASIVARTSFGADHHRIIGIAVFGQIKNDYDDYLGTGQPLKTNDDLKSGPRNSWRPRIRVGRARRGGDARLPRQPRQTYPMWGAGLQFILKPDKHMLASLEFAQGIEDNRGLILKLGYAW